MSEPTATTNPQPAGTELFNPKRCETCGEALEMLMDEKARKLCDMLGINKGVPVGDSFPVSCRCAVERYEAEKSKRETQEKIDRLRKIGIVDSQIVAMRFESDKGYNPSVLQTAKRYVETFDRMKRENIGIMFTGGVGTGKTFYAGCIANALIDNGVMVIFTSLTSIIKTSFEEYEMVLRSIERAGLVVFDDVGAERDTSFAWERAFDAVDVRVKSKKPIIVTTNLTPDDMAKATEIRERRIYDRILGSCIIVPVTGKSIRMQEQQNKLDMARQLLAGEK